MAEGAVELTTAEGIRVLTEKLKPLLAGQPPGAQGGALGELVSLWIAGHRPDLRQEIVDAWLEMVLALARENSPAIWGVPGPALSAFVSAGELRAH